MLMEFRVQFINFQLTIQCNILNKKRQKLSRFSLFVEKWTGTSSVKIGMKKLTSTQTIYNCVSTPRLA